MKPVHRAHKAPKLAQEDVISRMPENVIINIMNCLPIRDAMRTSILASNWRFRWTMLTRLVCDEEFSKYLQGPNGEESYDERNISRILLNLRGPITKFYLYIPKYKVLDVVDISHWCLFLSNKGIKELSIINMHQTPLMLLTHLFSCLELKYLRLCNCFFHSSCFRGSPRTTNKLPTMDALTYLKKIKKTFQDQEGKYAEFLDAVKDFKGKRVDTSAITARVRRIFEGHPDLILGFNNFLPKEYEITIDKPQAKKPVNFIKALKIMKSRHRARKESKLAQEDVISRMPENVITKIMNCLPIRDAMRTSILATNWRFRWTMLTKLVFDQDFSKYLQGRNNKEHYYERNISRILLNLKGPITKFYLYIPDYNGLDAADISQWVLFLSNKGIKELSIMNMHQTPLMLPTHLFSCLELKDLRLGNCFFHLPCSFRGFPNLLKLHLVDVSSGRDKVGKLITQCLALEDLRISHGSSFSTVKPIEISKLGNLNVLYFPLSKLDIKPLTSSSMTQFVGFFPKLQELRLDLSMCEFLAEVGARREVSVTFPCLKILGFGSIDFANNSMLSFIYEIICRYPNFQNIEILASMDYVPTCAEVDFVTTRQLQLRRVTFIGLKGSNNEVCFIKSLLACSPLLENITIGLNSSSMVDGVDGRCKFAEKLLKLHRASPFAEIALL